MRRFLTWKNCLIACSAVRACTCCLIIPGYVGLQQWRLEHMLIGKWKAEFERKEDRPGALPYKCRERLTIQKAGGYHRFFDTGNLTIDENGKWRIVPGAGKGAELVVEFETRLEFGLGKKHTYRRIFVPLEGDRIGMVEDSSGKRYDPPIAFERNPDP